MRATPLAPACRCVATVLLLPARQLRIQRRQPDWDHNPSPPLAARASALISLTIWVLMIVMGRFIAYNWYECGKPQSGFINAAQECAISEHGALPLTSAPPTSKSLNAAPAGGEPH